MPKLIKEHVQLDDVGFIRIPRNAPRFKGGTRPSTFTGKLKNSSDKDRVLNAIRQQKETSRQSNMPFYITPQTPLQVNETKKKLQEMNTKYREENVKTKIFGNKLVFPNGNVYRNRVQPPRAEGILTMDEEEIERQEVTVVVKGQELSQKGNTFKGLSSTIKTYAHIRNMYKKCSLTQN